MKERPIGSIVASLGKLSQRWLDKKYAFRKKAVARLVRSSGFSEAMAHALIDATFRELTAPKLKALLGAELTDARMLDHFVRGSRARGPKTIVHIFSSNIPNAAIWSLAFGMLLKSRNIGKPSSRDKGFLDIYLASLKTVDKQLYSRNRLLAPSERSAFSLYIEEAGLVVAYGSDDSLTAIRGQIPGGTPFIGYGHRVSAGLFLREALNDPKLAAKAAYDVWMADQRGCLSPTTFFVQRGGGVTPSSFAVRLAGELGRLQKKEKSLPRRDLASFSAVGRTHAESAVSRMKGKHSFVLESEVPGLWTVSFDEETKLALGASCQTISVRPFNEPEKILWALEPFRKHLQCVALEGPTAERAGLAEKLSALGVNRVCRAGKMQLPPITWHHDGQFNLASWVNWTDLEK